MTTKFLLITMDKDKKTACRLATEANYALRKVGIYVSFDKFPKSLFNPITQIWHIEQRYEKDTEYIERP